MAETRASTLRLNTTLADRLSLAALITEQSANDVIRDALETHLTALEKTTAYKERRAQLIIATTPTSAPPTRKGRQ